MDVNHRGEIEMGNVHLKNVVRLCVSMLLYLVGQLNIEITFRSLSVYCFTSHVSTDGSTRLNVLTICQKWPARSAIAELIELPMKIMVTRPEQAQFEKKQSTVEQN